ncbi:MAG: aminotransferase class I/II-fold pyridoxal phosphate-dependent enzyme [Pseudomonadota bacterium]
MNDISKIIVRDNLPLGIALKQLNESGLTVLFLVDQNGVLKRTITDGDVRRLLVSGIGLNDAIGHLDEQPPHILDSSASPIDALKLMDEFDIHHVPIVDSEGRPIDVIRRSDLRSRVQLSIPHMGEYERQFVEEAFESNWIAPLGPNVDAFEEEIAEYVGSQHAAALSSGTAAIHLALDLLNVGRDDIVFCSSFTFVASANPILYQGAEPVFIDSEPDCWNMSPNALRRAFEHYSKKGIRPKAVIVVHLYGQSANMRSIVEICDEYGVPVIEDAAESLGATYHGHHTGTIGKMGVFSFNGNKIITTSGGGMLISDDSSLIERARFLSTQARDSAPHYQHSVVGYNYRMSNILAGIGRGQLRVLNDRVEARRSIFARYVEGLRDIKGLDWMPEPEGSYSNRWLSAVSLNPEITGTQPHQLIEALSKENVEARAVWKPMHLQPLFDGALYFSHEEAYSYCDYLFTSSLCLPSASNMTNDQQDSVIDCIRSHISGKAE